MAAYMIVNIEQSDQDCLNTTDTTDRCGRCLDTSFGAAGSGPEQAGSILSSVVRCKRSCRRPRLERIS